MRTPSSDGRWLLVVELFALSALANAYLIAPASVLPVVMSELAIGAAAASWIVSVVFGIQILATVPVGFGLDRYDTRRFAAAATLAIVAAGVWGVASAAAGAYYSLVASRVLGGLGSLVFWNAGVSVLGRAFDDRRRATAIGVFTAGAPTGFALAQFLGPRIAENFEWTLALGVFGVCTLVPFAAFWASSRGLDVAVGSTTRPPKMADVSVVFENRVFWAVFVMGMATFSLYSFLNSWLPTYLTDHLGATLATSGLAVSLFPAMGVFARSGGGFLSDRVFGSRRRPVTMLSFLVPVPVVVAMTRTSTVAVVFVLVVLSGFFIQLAVGLLFTYVRELVRPSVATTAVAALTGASSIGSFVAPIAAGVLIERTGSYLPAFLLAALVGLVGLAMAYVTPEPTAVGTPAAD